MFVLFLRPEKSWSGLFAGVVSTASLLFQVLVKHTSKLSVPLLITYLPVECGLGRVYYQGSRGKPPLTPDSGHLECPSHAQVILIPVPVHMEEEKLGNETKSIRSPQTPVSHTMPFLAPRQHVRTRELRSPFHHTAARFCCCSVCDQAPDRSGK